MKKLVFLLVFFPTVIFANDNKGIVDELHINLTNIGASYSSSNQTGKVKNFGAGISLSLFNQISESVKLFAGISLYGGKRKSDEFETTNKAIGVFIGRRDMFKSSAINYFTNVNLQLSYNQNSVVYYSPLVTVYDPNSKNIILNVNVGKSFQFAKKQAVEAKIGFKLNYFKYQDGFLTSMNLPVGSVSWVYLFD